MAHFDRSVVALLKLGSAVGYQDGSSSKGLSVGVSVRNTVSGKIL